MFGLWFSLKVHGLQIGALFSVASKNGFPITMARAIPDPGMTYYRVMPRKRRPRTGQHIGSRLTFPVYSVFRGF